MTPADIRARHDRVIAKLVTKGLTSREISERLGLRYSYVRHCALRAGVRQVALANAQRQRETRRAAQSSVVKRCMGYRGSRIVEALPQPRTDRVASDLARALRADRAALQVLDASNLIACFHIAGLTLEDIEVGLGIPPAEAVAAIRRAHHVARP